MIFGCFVIDIPRTCSGRTPKRAAPLRLSQMSRPSQATQHTTESGKELRQQARYLGLNHARKRSMVLFAVLFCMIFVWSLFILFWRDFRLLSTSFVCFGLNRFDHCYSGCLSSTQLLGPQIRRFLCTVRHSSYKNDTCHKNDKGHTCQGKPGAPGKSRARRDE